MSATPLSIHRILPLCCVALLAAAQDDCTIRIVDDRDDDGDECQDLRDVCPNLRCEEFAQDDTGCPICECQQPDPDGNCVSDSDCPRGQFCSVACPVCADDSANCDFACEQGVCVDPNGGCRSDEECGRGARCDGGVCVIDEPGECGFDSDCRDGETCFPRGDCVTPDGSACQGICVPTDPPPPDGCRDDLDCGPGEICIFADMACDPSGSNCGVGTGICVPTEEPVSCRDDADCADGEMCVFVAVLCDDTNRECTGGICAPIPPAEPTCANRRCSDGAVCVETSNGPMCVFDGGEARCQSDGDCGDGEHCNAADLCLPPAGCENGNCPAVCEGVCVVNDDGGGATCSSDDDCREGQVCKDVSLCACADGDCLVACPIETICVDP